MMTQYSATPVLRSATLLITTLIALVFCVSAQAGVGLSATRMVFEGDAQAGQITFNNTGGTYLVQALVLPYDARHATGCFVVTPPVFRSESGTDSVLRVVRAGCHLSNKQESLFRLQVNAIPASDGPAAPNSSRVSIGLGSSIKLFYRPVGLHMARDAASKYLQFIRVGERVVAWNPTPYYLTFATLNIGGVSPNLNNAPSMVPPFSTVSWPVGHAAGAVKWSLVDDFGSVTPTLTKGIQSRREVVRD